MSDVITDVPGAPFEPVRAASVVDLHVSRAGVESFGFLRRLWDRIAPVIPATHPAGFGRLDLLDRGISVSGSATAYTSGSATARGMSAEFDGPLKHDGWPDARPEWADLTIPERDEHRQTCLDTCALCESARAWGVCPACGDGNAETDDTGDSYCCGIRVLFGDEAERAWNA